MLKLSFGWYLAIMAPKKRTWTGTVESALVRLRTVKEGQIVSVKGNVQNRSHDLRLHDVCFTRCDYM